jgi:hypothetical protein
MVRVRDGFVDAARRAVRAGIDAIELHGAHGYLLHSFVSPISNKRRDEYGGSFENRIRFVLAALRAVRAAWPEERPLSVRLSCTDWSEGGWTLEESVELSRRLKGEGADLIDAAGGLVPDAKIPLGADTSTAAEAVRRGADVYRPPPPDHRADAGGRDVRNAADLVLGPRRAPSPYWPIHAAICPRSEASTAIPPQYWRAIRPRSPRIPASCDPTS